MPENKCVQGELLVIISFMGKDYILGQGQSFAIMKRVETPLVDIFYKYIQRF
jgi:hypothetical protein